MSTMRSFPTNKIVQLTEITPYSRNAREHSPAQVAQIVASIREFGFTNPLLVDEQNVLIAGHGRLAAARSLGMAQLPAVVLEGLSDAQKAALRLADNKLALNATWDDDLLRTELADLRDVGFDLALTGFGEDELLGLFADGTEGLTDPDEVPEPPAEPVTQPGDVWLLGRHRLVCGDSTLPAAVDAALGGVRPHLMVTDPPYGVEYDANWRNEPEKLNLKSANVMKSATAARGKVMNDDRSDWTEAYALFPGEVAYVWHGERQSPELIGHMRACGFEPRNLIVWAKSSLVISRGHYHPQHETCWYLVRKGATGHWAGDRKQTTLWQIDKPHKSETGHSTQKPVECMRRPIENNSSPGQAVYEPFSGSGTTIIAAEMTGRACHAIEISPQYVDVAILRWQAFTGQTATRPDGTPYQAAHRETIPAN
jgi:DNA modification methylase